jgi:hypothetical protein
VCSIQKADYASLVDGAFVFDGNARVKDMVQRSLQQLGNNAADAITYNRMLLDTATVFYGRNVKAAMCAWRATDKYAVIKFQELQNCSLVKVNKDSLWVHDVIKSIASREAHTENMQCMTRVWLQDQVNTN